MNLSFQKVTLKSKRKKTNPEKQPTEEHIMSTATQDPHRDPRVVFDVREIPGRVQYTFYKGVPTLWEGMLRTIEQVLASHKEVAEGTGDAL